MLFEFKLKVTSSTEIIIVQEHLFYNHINCKQSNQHFKFFYGMIASAALKNQVSGPEVLVVLVIWREWNDTLVIKLSLWAL